MRRFARGCVDGGKSARLRLPDADISPELQIRTRPLPAGPTLVKKTVAIFLHHPFCSIESVNGVMQALSPGYQLRVFTKHKVPDGFFDDVDMVVFPGGHGDAMRGRKG